MLLNIYFLKIDWISKVLANEPVFSCFSSECCQWKGTERHGDWGEYVSFASTLFMSEIKLTEVRKNLCSTKFLIFQYC